jgi:tight adherence protein C
VILAEASLFQTTVVPLAVFGMFAALTWCFLDWVASRKPRAVERLDELKHPRTRLNLDALAVTKSDAVTKVLERATPALARALKPKSEAEINRLKARLAAAGFRSESAGSMLLGLKFLGLVAGVVIGSGASFPLWGTSQRTLVTTVALAGGLFYLPDLVLWFLVRGRRKALFLGLPDALDLLVVCVEAGLGLDQAMRRVAEEMYKTYGVIADEFGLANFQLQMGRPRAEVLHELGVRTGVSDLRNLAAVLIQAEKFGSSVALALRTQSDAMRTRRRQIAEEKAAKTAVKLIFPLVLFIFPGIFVVLVGPAAITMVREMFPMMSGGK